MLKKYPHMCMHAFTALQHCDTAQHIDDRGLNWEKSAAVCSAVCEPLTGGCNCNPGCGTWMATKAPAADTWARRFPWLMGTLTDRPGQPAYNNISNNTYCKCGQFIDATAADTQSWGTKVQQNVEVDTC
jgi:hypothetical protein